MRQRSDFILLYITKFERLLYEAKGQNWPDSNKIFTFRNSLSFTVRNRLTQQLALPREYSKFIRVVQKLAGSGPSSSNTHVNHGFHARNDTMDLSCHGVRSDALQQRQSVLLQGGNLRKESKYNK